MQVKTIEHTMSLPIHNTYGVGDFLTTYGAEKISLADHKKAWEVEIETQMNRGKLDLHPVQVDSKGVYSVDTRQQITFGGGGFLFDGKPSMTMTVALKGSKYRVAMGDQPFKEVAQKSLKEIVTKTVENITRDYFASLAEEEVPKELVLESRLRRWWDFFGTTELQNQQNTWKNTMETLKDDPSRLSWVYDELFRVKAMVDELSVIQTRLDNGESGLEILKDLRCQLVNDTYHNRTGSAPSQAAEAEGKRYAVAWILKRLDIRGITL
jgi:hypothetical protein